MAGFQFFTAKAVVYMALLMADLHFTIDDAAAAFGNLGHESGGFLELQEKRPIVRGSKGGYGWAMWTGPRRRQFESYCVRNSLDPTCDKANYGFLLNELRGPYSGTVVATKHATGLEAKVRAFEQHYECAGIKNYPSRYAWAHRAKDAYLAAHPHKA